MPSGFQTRGGARRISAMPHMIVTDDQARSQFDEARLHRFLQKCTEHKPALRARSLKIAAIVQEVAAGVCPDMTVDELLSLTGRITAARGVDHPQHGQLAGRIEIYRLRRLVPCTFSAAVEAQRNHRARGEAAPLVSDEFVALYNKHSEAINAHIDQTRDMTFDYFGVRTLVRSYLLRGVAGTIMELPQYMYMRVAIAVHGGRGTLDDILESYDDMSLRRYTHASPTLFNAGTRMQQLSSCFLVGVKADSIDGIFGTLHDCARISKTAGGLGISVSNVRASGAYIRGTQGTSNGLVPMLRVFNDMARYVDQGGGKRKGAAAIYIEPWHADILSVLPMKDNQGHEELRARDLFYALWVNDLFMQRVEANGQWTLFCPSVAPGLQGAYGDAFRELYEKYEREGRGAQTIKARDLWALIIETQMETGGPYMLFKDACNAKSNHRHLGTINCSNLCTEIVQYTSPDEVAVCNLGSLCLPSFVSNGQFDHAALHSAAARLALSLDRVIDVTYYPVEAARRSNQRHRPIGIGVQGLADVFAMLMLPYDGPEARELNRDIFETIHHAALSASCALSALAGAYETYDGSPVSRGELQCDAWGVTPSTRWDWPELRRRIQTSGLRNSLLTAPMPTASTAQIAGNNESFEPAMSNLFVRRVLSGEFVVVNRHMVAALEAEGKWPALRDDLVRCGGSVQNLPVSQKLKDVFRTAWEMKQRPLVDMAADRAPYIDQSQSFNVFMAAPTAQMVNALHMYAWRKGLKTGMYYLHTRPAIEAVPFSVAQDKHGECESCGA